MEKEIWCYYEHMPHHWITDLHWRDCTPRIHNCLELDMYLKKMGFTGIPEYKCTQCESTFRMADDTSWACTFAYIKFMKCLVCDAQGTIERLDKQIENPTQL
jgi:transposase-like protein